MKESANRKTFLTKFAVIFCVGLVGQPCFLSAQNSTGQISEPAATQSASPQNPDDDEPQSVTAATVGSFEISMAAAKRLVKKSVPNLGNASENPVLLNAAVNRLVDRVVIYHFLTKQDRAAGPNEIKLQLETFSAELAKIDQTIDDHLATTGLKLSEVEFEFAWRIAWNRFLKEKINDDYLQNYFDNHRRQFDGSEMRVSHLLIKPTPAGGVATAYSIAKQISKNLENKVDSWEEAVKKYSQAPTSDSGGEIGWISFHKPMPNEFSTAAFQLKLNEISPPVKTHFGAHLIKCLEIRDGKIGWRDAIDDVRESAVRDLFKQISREHREQVVVKFNDGFSAIK